MQAGAEQTPGADAVDAVLYSVVDAEEASDVPRWVQVSKEASGRHTCNNDIQLAKTAAQKAMLAMAKSSSEDRNDGLYTRHGKKLCSGQKSPQTLLRLRGQRGIPEVVLEGESCVLPRWR